MRITQSMLQRSLLRNIQSDMSRLAEAQQRVATGKRIQIASDDPVGAAQVMRATEGLRALDQYRRNNSAARTRLDTEEAVLSQLTDLLSRAREIATAMGTDTASASALSAGHAEVVQLLDQVIQLGNTSVGEGYIFGGHQTANPPFQSDGSYTGDGGELQVDIGRGYRIDTNHSGDEMFVSSGVISSLVKLRDALAASDNAAARNSLGDLSAAFDQTQVLLSETGARLRQLDVAMQNLEALNTSLTAGRLAAEAVGLEQAAVELFGIQNTLQAALASTARVLSTNLTDYLR
jgi:flagellar hook-associated protein 3 FlgL